MNDYENLKKKYGERFAKFCRTSFPTALETDGMLSSVIEKYFHPSKTLYEDIAAQDMIHQFKNFVYSKMPNIKRPVASIQETPKELFAKAGYKLYECKTYAEIQKFKKFYTADEEICTFRDPYRLNSHRIFFAVKNNAKDIKRENFSEPQRQDEYGTSVISIQFNKVGNYLSIKNRYNHTVKNPDATFGNNLDNIYPGLTESFEKYYGIIQQSAEDDFKLANYAVADDGKYYHCNYKLFPYLRACSENILIFDGKSYKLDKNRYELIDYYLLDKKNKTITAIFKLAEIKNFLEKLNSLEGIEINQQLLSADAFTNIYGNPEKIEITKEQDGNRCIKLTLENGNNCYIIVNSKNQIIGFRDDNIKKIDDGFFIMAEYIQSFSAESLESVGRGFCTYSKELANINLPNLKSAGPSFLTDCKIQHVYLPSIQTIAIEGFSNCLHIKTFDAPNLISVDNYFLNFNKSIEILNTPQLTTIGNYFIEKGGNLSELNLPNCQTVGVGFLRDNTTLKNVNIGASKVGRGFIQKGGRLTTFNAPNLTDAEEMFLSENKTLKAINLPKLKKLGHSALKINKKLLKVNVPHIQSMGEKCFEGNVLAKMSAVRQLKANTKERN